MEGIGLKRYKTTAPRGLERGEKVVRTPLKLTNAAQIRASLSRVANAVWLEDIEVSEANSITQTANVILSSIRLDEQQKKILGLEQKIEELEGTRNGR